MGTKVKTNSPGYSACVRACGGFPSTLAVQYYSQLYCELLQYVRCSASFAEQGRTHLMT